METKVLMGLKCLAFGVSPACFPDFFPMVESTGRECVTRVVATAPELREVYLRPMSRSDAQRVTKMHFELHGIPGNMGSLD